MPFIPDAFVVPTGFETDRLLLRVLTPAVVDLDYDALMSSRVRLRAWSDSNWPADDFTLAGNHADLAEHEREFHAREAFAYTVLSRDGARCEGCVYLNPLAGFVQRRRIAPEPDAIAPSEDDAALSFWVRDDALARGLDRELLAGLRGWLAGWPLGRVFVLTNDRMPGDHALLQEAGLAAAHVLASEAGDRRWHLWPLATTPERG